MGRKKKPTKLKIIQGTYRKDRANENEPKPKQEIPKPKYGLLSKEERKQYDRVAKILDDMQVLTEADVIALELLAQSLARYYKMKKELKKKGYTYEYKTKTGAKIKQVRPGYQVFKDARDTALQLMARFGLDPSNRTKVVTRPSGGDSKWD